MPQSILIFVATFVLMFTKLLDLHSTYINIKGVDMERNLFGRFLFKKLGVKSGIIAVGLIALIMVAIVAISVYKYNVWFYTILYCVLAVFISWIQLSVAINNYTKKPPWIVKQINRFKFYR